ncbi:MAG: FAD-dependent oxidoreductase [Chloroflexi bacterium]|nr:FAD-dependent oxidoreductase [Chloroflexota bacterium]
MPERALASYEPGLNRQGLRAAYTFYDAQVEFPERLVAEALRDFTDAGGVALNHTTTTALRSPGGVLRGLAVRDSCGATAEVESACIVNAAGPWVDMVLAGTDAERHDPLIGGTKGSHLVVDWPQGPTHGVFASAREDGRPFFILPWYRYTLIGTTDLRYDGDPGAARCTRDELRYLLDEATRLFPSTPLREDHVLYTYCGVRPLPYTPAGDESTISRSHFIIDHVKRGGPRGLLSVVGGKLTTYRSLARMALPAIARHAKPSLAAQAPASFGDAVHAAGPLCAYGRRAAEVEALAAREPSLRQPICSHNDDILAQVAYAVDCESARTLGDALLRRTPVGWSACHALDGAAKAADVMGARLGWDTARTEREIEAYALEVRETLVAPAHIAEEPGGQPS